MTGRGRTPSTNPAGAGKTLRAETLAQAHKVVRALRPAEDAPVSEWVAFRRRSAAIYDHVADVDRFHHHEALYWAQQERAAADQLAEQVTNEARTSSGIDADQDQEVES